MPPLPTLERAEWTSPSWDALVREHADRVYRLAHRLSGNRVDAEDLTQETFVRMFQALPNFRPGTFEGWLHRIPRTCSSIWCADVGGPVSWRCLMTIDWLHPRPDPTRCTSNCTSMPISSRP